MPAEEWDVRESGQLERYTTIRYSPHKTLMLARRHCHRPALTHAMCRGALLVAHPMLLQQVSAPQHCSWPVCCVPSPLCNTGQGTIPSSSGATLRGCLQALSRALILLVSYDDSQGALGLVVNRPLPVTVSVHAPHGHQCMPHTAASAQ